TFDKVAVISPTATSVPGEISTSAAPTTSSEAVPLPVRTDSSGPSRSPTASGCDLPSAATRAASAEVLRTVIARGGAGAGGGGAATGGGAGAGAGEEQPSASDSVKASSFTPPSAPAAGW